MAPSQPDRRSSVLGAIRRFLRFPRQTRHSGRSRMGQRTLQAKASALRPNPSEGNPRDSTHDETVVDEIVEYEQPRVSDLGGVISFNIRQHREVSRRRIAYGLLLLVAFIVVAAFVSLWTEWGTWSELKELSAFVLGPVVGLAGAATGFFFGEKASE